MDQFTKQEVIPETIRTISQENLAERGRSVCHPDINGSRIVLPAKAIASQFSSSTEYPGAEKHTQWPGNGEPGDPVFDSFYMSQADSLNELAAGWISEWLTRKNFKRGNQYDSYYSVSNCNHNSAHTDVVFPDLEELPMTIDGDKISAPGIGDDTGNLVNLLMGLKYLLTFPGACPYGIVIAANSCEEGLGNLDGTRQIMKTYEGRIKEFISFDGYAPQCCSRAVGSHRYQITIKTEGGHSCADFGNASAVKIAVDVIPKMRVSVNTDF